MLEIEKLVYGGAGLARENGKVWLVPMTAPGDIVEAEPLRDRGNMIEGILKAVIKPSDTRREPPCPWYSICGGCQLQHMNYEAQFESRKGFVIESLKRAGIELKCDIEFIPAPMEFGYRNRVQMAVRDGKTGFLKRHSNEIIEIDKCPALLPKLDGSIGRIREYVKKAGPRTFPMGQVFAAAGEDGDIAVEPSVGSDFKKEVGWTVGEIGFKFAPDIFFQANALLLEPFWSVVKEGAGGGNCAVDMYSGVGFFTLALARTFKNVVAVEESRPTAAFGRNAAKAAGIGNVRILASRVEELAVEDFDAKPDLVLADPPRAGLSKKAFQIAAGLDAERIVYISCDPASLARDVKKFYDRGWAPSRVVVLDMFPQTYHVEIVVFMEKRREE